MTRVPFGASPSPFLLAATVRHHLKKYEQTNPNITEILNKCFYVDDLICSVPSVAEAITFSLCAKSILESAGMELCKWSTNSAELKLKWNETMKFSVNEKADVKSTGLKVLGLNWQTSEDVFTFDLNNLMEFTRN